MDTHEHQRTGKQLKQSRAQLRALSERLIASQEEERRRIARDVHDELGQSLIALKFDLSWLDQHLPAKPECLRQKTAAMMHVVDRTLDTLRSITTRLWPRVLDDLGLLAAVEMQAQEFQRHTSIATSLTVFPAHFQPEPIIATTVFRVLQEALTNVARHAQATQVAIRLRVSGSTLRLSVRDNGIGISQDALTISNRLGLAGLRERVMACGGSMRIRGRTRIGTVLTVRLPLGPEENQPHGDAG